MKIMMDAGVIVMWLCRTPSFDEWTRIDKKEKENMCNKRRKVRKRGKCLWPRGKFYDYDPTVATRRRSARIGDGY